MNRHRKFPIIPFIVLVVTPILQARTIVNDFDPDAPFGKYKTFSFTRGSELERTGVLKNPETRDRVRNLIGGVLQTKGMHEIPRDENFDLAVRFWIGIQHKVEYDSIPVTDPFWGVWGGYPLYTYGPWLPYYTQQVERHYSDGSMIVDMIDGHTKQLVWRTYLTDTLKTPDKVAQQVQDDVAKGFAAYPPSPSDIEKARKRRAKAGAK
jgi:hypothetical protein